MNSYQNNLKLKVENISKSFNNERVLDNIYLKLFDSEIISIVGESGSGKTTLFNIIAGLLSPDNGNVLLKGRDITNKTGIISYMLQKDLLLPHLTILENVSLPLIIKGVSKKEALDRSRVYFEKFGLLGTEDKYPWTLSGGMAQRAALLRTYMFSSEVVLLDEPFSALDAITRSNIHDWYLTIKEELNLSTIFITHDIEEAIKLSDRIYILASSPGRIVKEMEIESSIKSNPDFILSPKFLDYKREILEYLNTYIVKK